MKTRLTALLGAGLLALTVGGCSKQESTTPTAPPASAPEGVEIPTQDEADERAAAEIDAAGADAAFDDLAKEIEAEGGG